MPGGSSIAEGKQATVQIGAVVWLNDGSGKCGIFSDASFGKHNALTTLSFGSHYQMAYTVLQMYLDSNTFFYVLARQLEALILVSSISNELLLRVAALFEHFKVTNIQTHCRQSNHFQYLAEKIILKSLSQKYHRAIFSCCICINTHWTAYFSLYLFSTRHMSDCEQCPTAALKLEANKADGCKKLC